MTMLSVQSILRSFGLKKRVLLLLAIRMLSLLFWELPLMVEKSIKPMTVIQYANEIIEEEKELAKQKLLEEIDKN